MNHPRSILKGTTLLTATLGVGLGFVAVPAVTAPLATGSAPTSAAAPAPVTPAVKQHALQGRATRAVAAAGPQTRVVQAASLPRDASGKTVAPAGAPTPVDPALEAGAADDAVVELPATGDMVGVTWPGSTTMAPRATVAVRAHNAKGWSDWQELEITAVKDQKDTVTKYGTDPIWVDGATSVQVRVAPEAKALLGTAQLAAVTSPKAATDATLTPTPVPGAANAAYIPSVISRAQWGANERLRNGCTPSINPTTRVVVVHHTAGSNNYTADQSASIVRGIYAYDTQSLGWCDVAYNMIVDKYGQRFEGRYGGLSRSVKGAHADSFNTRTFGISILGNYDVTPVPEAGMRALKQGIAMRLSQFYINPYGRTTLYSEYTGTTSRYPKGAAYQANNIAGHRESSNTACPGRYLYPRLGELRDGAAALAGWTGSGYSSPIYKRWVAAGGEARHGYVTDGERTVAPGLRVTDFSGAHIYDGPYGTKIIGHGLNASWLAKGGVAWGGYPWTDEIGGPGGWYVELSKNKTMTFSRSGVGTWTEGAIRVYWVNQAGGMWGSLGAPVAPMQAIPGGYQQQFAGGLVKFDSATGKVWRA